jgi:enterochelin esterase family protein
VNLAIHRLIHGGDTSDGAIDAFLRAHSFPLVEGPHVTFVFRGQADRVVLRHFIFGLPSTMAFERLQSTDLWYSIVELPPGSRVEYKLDVHQGNHHEWIRDPLNPQVAHDPFGGNSVAHGDGYTTGDWIEHDPEAREGRLEHHVIQDTPFGGDDRQVMLYLPARFRETRRFPLVIVHDGEDYLRFARLKTVLDNLIHRGEVQPLIAVCTQSPNRLGEYADDARHVAFLADTLTPWVESHYPTYGNPDSRCLMGASFGGVASLSAAWHRPGFFGRLLLQSGSFAFSDIGEHQRGPAFDPVARFVNRFREAPGKPSSRVFVSCGTYESLIYENRSMLPLLQETGMEVRYVEARDGHNWENWRDRLREGLSWLFPGHLWMVYE